MAMDREKLFSAEKKLAYVRVFTVVFTILLFTGVSGGVEKKSFYILSSIGILYSLILFPVISKLKNVIDIASKIIILMDALLIGLCIAHVGVSEHTVQLFFLAIIAAALRTCFIFTVLLAVFDVFVMTAAGVYHDSTGTLFWDIKNAVQSHFEWYVYLLLIAVTAGLISEEVGKERRDRREKEHKLDYSEKVIEKYTLFVEKVTLAAQSLLIKDAKVEVYMESVANDILDLTRSKNIQFTVFNNDDEIEYIARQPMMYTQKELEVVKVSQRFKNVALSIAVNYPFGVIFNHLEHQPLFKGLPFMVHLGKHLLCGISSLKNGKKIIIFVVNDEFEYNEIDLAMIQSFCLNIGYALEHKERSEIYQEKCIIENEFKVTADVQRALFPNKILEVNNMRMGCYYSPSMFVTGDYVDYFMNTSGKCIMVVADIMGNGLSKGFLTLGLRSALRIFANEELDAAKLLERLNKHICGNYSELYCFVTMIVGIFDFGNHTINASNAGHMTPMMWIKKEYVEKDVDVGGIALGIDPDAEYTSFTGEVRSNSLILLYTDGITEARNNSGASFGRDGLRKSVEEYFKEHDEVDIDALQSKIKDDLYQFIGNSQWSDDWSLLLSITN